MRLQLPDGFWHCQFMVKTTVFGAIAPKGARTKPTSGWFQQFSMANKGLGRLLAVLATVTLFALVASVWNAWTNDLAVSAPSLVTLLLLLGLQSVSHRARIRQDQASLALACQTADALLAHMEEGAMLVSPGKRVELCNPQAMTMLELTSDLVQTQPDLADILIDQGHQDDPGSISQPGWSNNAAVGLEATVHVYRRRDGRRVDIRNIALPGGRSLRLCSHAGGELAARSARRRSDILVPTPRSDGITLAYQPVLDTETGALRSLVARSLRVAPDGTAPDEAVVLDRSLDNWVLETACREAATWAMPIHLSVPLSRGSMADSGLVEHIREVLHLTGLDADRLMLELPVSYFVAGMPRTVRATLTALRDDGVGLILTEAGQTPTRVGTDVALFRKVKIDGALIGAMLSDPLALQAVRDVLEDAAGMGAEVVADGVTENTEREMLRMLGCSGVQGALLGYPRPPEWARDFLWRANTQFAK